MDIPSKPTKSYIRKMRRFLLLSVWLISTPVFTQRTVEYWDNGQIKSEGKLDDGKRIGRWKMWDQWGNLISSGNYIDGLKEGKWKDILPANVLYDSVTYPYLYNHFAEYYISEGYYKHGLKSGTWHCYDVGYIRESRTYLYDTLDGQFIQFYNDFQDSRKNPYAVISGYFKNGNKEGQWKFLNLYLNDPIYSVPLSAKGDYELDLDGLIIVFGSFKENKRDSIWNYWAYGSEENNYGIKVGNLNILSFDDIRDFVNKIDSLNQITLEFPDQKTFSTSQIWGTLSLSMKDGFFEGEFNLKKVGVDVSSIKYVRLEEIFIQGQNFKNKFDSLYTDISNYKYVDSIGNVLDYYSKKNEISFKEGKKTGFSINSTKSFEEGYRITRKTLYQNDTVLEILNYDCIDWGNQQLHLLTKFKDGLPIAKMLIDSLNNISETVLNIRSFRTTINTTIYNDNSNTATIQPLTYNIIIPYGEVYDLDSMGDTIFKYIFTDSIVKLPDMIVKNPYHSVYYKNYWVIPTSSSSDITFPFKICEDIGQPLLKQYLELGPVYQFKPGYYRYWVDGKLKSELYLTYLNDEIYYYKRTFIKGSAQGYTIEASRDSKTRQPNVVKTDNKIFTINGIYLFTLDLNKNH